MLCKKNLLKLHGGSIYLAFFGSFYLTAYSAAYGSGKKGCDTINIISKKTEIPTNWSSKKI